MWNPKLYNTIGDIFNFNVALPELMKLVNKKFNLRVIDLGCGSGEITNQLAETLPNSNVLGIDCSPHMIQSARAFERKQLQFLMMHIEEVVEQKNRWDLVFSHQSMQWVPNHQAFFPKLISTISEGGQLAMNMVMLDKIFFKRDLDELANKNQFKAAFQGWRCLCPVLTNEDYANILYKNGGTNITVFKKVFPVLIKDADGVFDFASTTVLIPYLKHLPEELHQSFIEEYKKMLRNKYPGSPVLSPHQRLFLAATF